MGRAVITLDPAVLASLLGAHAGKRVYHRVTGGGLPEDATITDVWWEDAGTALAIEVESASWPEQESFVEVPTLELGAYVLELPPQEAAVLILKEHADAQN